MPPRTSSSWMPLRLLLLLYCVACTYLLGWFEPVAADIDITTAHCHTMSSVLDMIHTECICEPCNLCFFKFAAWTCRSLADDSTADVLVPFADGGLSLGLTLDQPLLHADDWFLTVRELTRSRGGVARDNLAVFTNNNHVELFSATNTFFAAVYNDFEALHGGKNDTSASDTHTSAQVWLTGWSLDDVPFRPAHRHWQRSTLRSLLGRAMERNVTVRALVWANVLEQAQNIAMQHWLNSFDRFRGIASTNRRGLLLFDNRLPHATSSHHQKTLVLRRVNSSDSSADVVAYVGGIDLTTDRWDTRFHNSSRLRRLRSIARSYDGWLDASLRLEGPAALDVAANFAARWNAKTPPLQPSPNDELFAFKNPSTDSLNVTVPTLLLSPHSKPIGSVSVQIVRTFSCKVKYEFAPYGELSLLHARLKAIARAQNYIYIEDQYFILVPALLDALLLALPRIKVLVVVTQLPSLETAVVGYTKLLHAMLSPLRTEFPDKIHVYTMKPALELYIHTKVVLIDDVFLSIGSGNWNQRSMTSDSEIAANVVDRDRVETPDGITVTRLARAFRLAKFSELSGVSVDELDAMTLFEGIHELERATRSTSSLLSHLDVAFEAYFDLFPQELEDVIDPFDVCSTP